MKQTAIMMTLLLALVAGATAKPMSMSLQVRKGDLRSSPSFLGRIVGTAAYGDRFTIAEERGAWRRVPLHASWRIAWARKSVRRWGIAFGWIPGLERRRASKLLPRAS